MSDNNTIEIGNCPVCSNTVQMINAKHQEEVGIDPHSDGVIYRKLDLRGCVTEYRMENLNDIKIGSELEFDGVAPGVVVDIWRKVADENGNTVEARLVIKHEDLMESYHTYRRDGRSNHSPSHDITSAIG